MRVRVIKCDKYMCTVAVPYSCLILTPGSDKFELISLFPLEKRFKTGAVLTIPRGSFLRVGRTPKAKYYLIDGDVIELKGVRAKIIGRGWGWHYKDNKGNYVLTVYYENGVFYALRPSHRQS